MADTNRKHRPRHARTSRTCRTTDDDEMPTDPMTLNMGPSHPAMHGTVRIVLTVDGETRQDADVQVGYLHRCFEKEAEHATYTQVFPYTDRLNYVSPMINNFGYAMAVEKLLGITAGSPSARSTSASSSARCRASPTT